MSKSSKTLSIHDLPDDQRPRERLLNLGAGALADAELLAIILRTGTSDENVIRLAERLLQHFNGLNGLAQAAPGELTQMRGLGSAKASQVAAALELGKRLMTGKPQERPQITCAADAVRLVADMHHLSQEHVRLILLDLSRRVIATPTVYIGTINASVLRISELLREPVTRNSPSIILVHNHPSGNSHPSPEDIELTRTLDTAARLLDITLIDHLIIGHDSWSSLKELGLGFSS
jgi:DNA repair protein RadC